MKIIGYEDSEIAYTPFTVKTPVFGTEITRRENFIRAARYNEPEWIPNALTDIQTLGSNDIIDHSVNGMQIHSDFRRDNSISYEFRDWFNTEWTWVVSAGGPMLKPGSCLLSDITKWESVVKFPSLNGWGFESRAEEYMKTYNPAKILNYDIGRGLTERLVSIMGGYEGAMLALAVEPEACAAFFERYADFVIATFDKINSLYPIDMLTYHDDWGSERDTFFSSRMYEDLIHKPTKRIIDHIHEKDVIFQLHSCGNVTRFAPYIAELKPEFVQLQRRAVDFPALKKRYGNAFGFTAGLEIAGEMSSLKDEELRGAIRETSDLYAKGGGFYLVFSGNEHQTEVVLSELYSYGREIYGRE